MSNENNDVMENYKNASKNLCNIRRLFYMRIYVFKKMYVVNALSTTH